MAALVSEVIWADIFHGIVSKQNFWSENKRACWVLEWDRSWVGKWSSIGHGERSVSTSLRLFCSAEESSLSYSWSFCLSMIWHFHERPGIFERHIVRKLRQLSFCTIDHIIFDQREYQLMARTLHVPEDGRWNSFRATTTSGTVIPWPLACLFFFSERHSIWVFNIFRYCLWIKRLLIQSKMIPIMANISPYLTAFASIAW